MTSIATVVLDTSRAVLKLALRVFPEPWAISACRHIPLLPLLHPGWRGHPLQPLRCLRIISSPSPMEVSLLISPHLTLPFIRTVHQTLFYPTNSIIHLIQDPARAPRMYLACLPRLRILTNSRIRTPGQVPCNLLPFCHRRCRRHQPVCP